METMDEGIKQIIDKLDSILTCMQYDQNTPITDIDTFFAHTEALLDICITASCKDNMLTESELAFEKALLANSAFTDRMDEIEKLIKTHDGLLKSHSDYKVLSEKYLTLHPENSATLPPKSPALCRAYAQYIEDSSKPTSPSTDLLSNDTLNTECLNTLKSLRPEQ